MVDVCLVLMPYASISRPSYALGALKACLRERGIRSKVLYPNIWFAEEIGVFPDYAIAGTHPARLLGEWTFAGVAFPDGQPDDVEFLHAAEELFREGTVMQTHEDSSMTELLKGSSITALLREIREKAEGFVDRTAHAVLELGPRIVGCSSTFQQNCAALALLRKVRELSPETVTVMGGANCEGPMGQAIRREFPWVDFVVSGEGEECFPDLCEEVFRHGREIPEGHLPYGVVGASAAGAQEEAPRAIVRDLDTLPVPDFDDYFEALKRSKLRLVVNPTLLIATSRGCWWGQKCMCTFCGLNGTGVEFRSKSTARVKRELAQLATRYGLRRFETVDNILDMSYFKDLIPDLAESEEKYSIFFETKANLSRDQVRQLAAAGVRHILPGIEGLHDGVLKIMAKGTTTMANLQLLKWSREMDVDVKWFLLVEIPQEPDGWYDEVAQWIHMISHFQPPWDLISIMYCRYSPYQVRPQDFGLELSPQPWYSYVYPISKGSIEDLAYFFQESKKNVAEEVRADGSAGLPRLREKVRRWMRAHCARDSRPELSIIEDCGARLEIVDTRPCAVESRHTLTGLAYHVYLLCDRARSPAELRRAVGSKLDREVAWNELRPLLEHLKERKLLLELSDRLFSLAVDATREPSPAAEFPRGSIDWASLPELGY